MFILGVVMIWRCQRTPEAPVSASGRPITRRAT